MEEPCKTYGPRWDARPYDPSRCAEPMYRGRGALGHQCSKPPVKDGYCWHHHPDREAEKMRRQNEAAAARQRQMARLYAGEALDALRSIASGHNDPARLARETLEKLGMQKEPAE